MALATIQTPSRWLPYHPTLGIPSTWTSVVLFLQESIFSLSSTHTHDSPEVVIVRLTFASCIIQQLDRIFSTHGIPHVVRSDNGPPFTSEEIREYMRENGIDHRRITLLWPQANSEAERFMVIVVRVQLSPMHCTNTKQTKKTSRLSDYLTFKIFTHSLKTNFNSGFLN